MIRPGAFADQFLLLDTSHSLNMIIYHEHTLTLCGDLFDVKLGTISDKNDVNHLFSVAGGRRICSPAGQRSGQ